MQHDHLIEKTLYDLTISIVEYVYKFHAGYEFSVDLHKSGQRLITSIESSFGIIVASIVDKFAESIRKDDQPGAIKLLKLLEFTFGKLMLLEHYSEPELMDEHMKVALAGLFNSCSNKLFLE